jgi:hypothetical protein
VFGISDSSYIKRQLDFAHAQLDSRQNYFENLSDNNIIDFYMIQNQLKVRFSIDKLKSYEWNPAEYNVCGALLNGKYDSLEVRLHSFNIKMDAIPAYYEAAKANIKSN